MRSSAARSQFDSDRLGPCAPVSFAQVSKRKRDKQKKQAASWAERMIQYRLLKKAQAKRMEKPSGCLRELHQRCCGDALRSPLGVAVRVVKWAPTESSVVEFDQSAGES